VEKFHMKFIKEILGVHCKASNVTCRPELGRLPLWAKISFYCIRFWKHLLTSENALIQGLFNSIVFFILKYAFLAFSISKDTATLKLPLYFNIAPE
jgi:hypothetical protein